MVDKPSYRQLVMDPGQKDRMTRPFFQTKTYMDQIPYFTLCFMFNSEQLTFHDVPVKYSIFHFKLKETHL